MWVNTEWFVAGEWFLSAQVQPASSQFNPFTPESDQCQNSPAASQEIWHHTVWRTWLFIAYSDEKWLYYKFSLHYSYNRFLKGWENTLFELRSERVNPFTPKGDQFKNISPAASPDILHHTVWRTWLLIAYSDERWLSTKFSLPLYLHISLQECWENVLFELRRVPSGACCLAFSQLDFKLC